MCGVSGSGKTFLSRQFEEMGFHRVSVDDIAWSAYGPGLNDMPFGAKKNVFMEASAEAGRQIETLLALYLDTPGEILSQRLENRKGTGPDDQIVTPAQLESFLANFEKPDADENFITVVCP